MLNSQGTELLCPLLLPLGWAFVWLLFGQRLWANKGLALAGTALVYLPAFICIGITLFGDQTPSAYSFNWLQIGSLNLSISFLADEVAALMLAAALTVSVLVQMYSMEYMRGPENFGRYYAGINFFTAAMSGLVLSQNLVFTFCCWELMGFCSYALIGFHYQKPDAAPAALKAFMLNRIADTGFLILLMVCGALLHTFNYEGINYSLGELTPGFNENPSDKALLIFAGFGLIWAAAGKSAQFPFQVWLPSAMAGPTPVSALIHAATMVAAGIFLLIRLNFILLPPVADVLAWLASLTALSAAMSAWAQTDLKKVLAYSTISQLGLMAAAIGCGAPEAALLHLLTHAFFKAGLFLCAANVINALHTRLPYEQAQDMRLMGGIAKKMPITAVCFGICAAALAGLPLSSGFLSKEAVVGAVYDSALQSGQTSAYLLFTVVLLTSAFTAAYSLRAFRMIFIGNFRGIKVLPAELITSEGAASGNINISLFQSLKDPGLLMRIPVLVLAFCSLYAIFSVNPIHLSPLFSAFGKIKFGSYQLIVFTLSMIVIGFGTACRNLSYLSSTASGVFGKLMQSHFGWDDIWRKWFSPAVIHLSRFFAFAADSRVNALPDGVSKVTVVLAHFSSALDRFIVDGMVKASGFTAGAFGRFAGTYQGFSAREFISAAAAGLLLLLWFIL
ncbi:MAG: NADH-quinone oxidoreductase subunit L [Bacteroidota bacterium]